MINESEINENGKMKLIKWAWKKDAIEWDYWIWKNFFYLKKKWMARLMPRYDSPALCFACDFFSADVVELVREIIIKTVKTISPGFTFRSNKISRFCLIKINLNLNQIDGFVFVSWWINILIYSSVCTETFCTCFRAI